MIGINIRRISWLTFATGSSLAAVAGSLIGPVFAVSPSMGHMEVLKGFVIIILGGMGSIPGAIFGGFILGIAESLGGSYISSLYKDLIPFAVLVIILSLKPEGLFTKRRS
jgi:branched-chain amino acid transport system permease protein